MCDHGNLVCEGIASVAKGAFEQIAESAAGAAGQMIVDSLTWWVRTPSVNPQNPAVATAQAYTLPLIALVLMGSVLVQAIRMTLSRKRDPALNVGVGLVRYFVTATVGVVVLAGAVKAADDFSAWVVGQTMVDFSTRMKAVLTAAVITNPFSLLAMGGLGYLLGAVQWVLGFIRQAGILVLAALLPLAASGSINESTKPWLNRMLPWLLTLVLYRPMAALIYMIGFTFLGTGNDVTTVMTGLMVLVLAVVAMPAMMRFFSWAGVSVTGGGGSGDGWRDRRGVADRRHLARAGQPARHLHGPARPRVPRGPTPRRRTHGCTHSRASRPERSPRWPGPVGCRRGAGHDRRRHRVTHRGWRRSQRCWCGGCRRGRSGGGCVGCGSDGRAVDSPGRPGSG